MLAESIAIALGVIGLLVLVKATDHFMHWFSKYAREVGLNAHLIGIVLVSAMASLPEMATAVAAGAVALPEIGANILLGTNIAHLFFVMGVIAIFGHGRKVHCPVLERSKIALFVLTFVPFLLMLDQQLSRMDGVYLIGFYILYLGILYIKEGKLWKSKLKMKMDSVSLVHVVISGLAIVASAYWIMKSATFLTNPALLTLVSLTAIPLINSFVDLLVGIQSIVHKSKSVAVGDILGSSMSNYLLGLGVLALIFPFGISILELAFVFTFSMLGMALFLFHISEGKLDWHYGVTLLLCYVFYVIIQGVNVL